VVIKISIFWDTSYSLFKSTDHTPCSLRLYSGFFLLVCCLTYSSTLKMEMARSSKMLVNFQRTTQRYIPKDLTLQSLNDFFTYNLLPVSCYIHMFRSVYIYTCINFCLTLLNLVCLQFRSGRSANSLTNQIKKQMSAARMTTRMFELLLQWLLEI
jgi:hypothetical protein